MQTDITQIIDPGLTLLQKLYPSYNQHINAERFFITKPIGLKIYFEQLNLSTTQSAIDSFKINLKFVPSQVIDQYLNLNYLLDPMMRSILKLLGLQLPNDNTNDLATVIKQKLDTKFAAYSDVNITFTQTDVKNLLNSSIQ